MIGFLLTIVAILLSMIIIPIGVLWSVIKYPKNINEYFYRIALSIDQLGNVACAPLLNEIMIKRKVDLFGDEDETISSVLGKNYKNNNLTWFGNIIRLILDKIEKDHCIKSIEN